MNAQPQPVNGETPIAISLTINQWQQVLNLMTEGQWKLANPLIIELQKQIQIALTTPGI